MTITQLQETSSRQLQDIADTIAAAKKVVVITGAGISTNCGIPDFRSEGGMYARIQSQHDRASTAPNISSSPPAIACPKPKVKGKDLFDYMVWRNQTSTSVFYKFIASLRKSIQDDVRSTSTTHRFIRTLRDQRKLVRCYTQNIDSLEEREGLCTDFDRGKGSRARFSKKAADKSGKVSSMVIDAADRGCEVVQLHGDLRTLRCTLCQQNCEWDTTKHSPRFLDGRAPRCPSCVDISESRQHRGKRGTKIGTLRPSIVLYGEEHPHADAIGDITTYDLASSPDLLLVLGTSLHVQGVKTLVREFAKAVHARPGKRGKVVYINLSKPAESVWKDVFDCWIRMDCDRWVGAMKECRPDIWHSQAQLSLSVTKKPAQPKNVAPSMAKADKENIILDSEDSLPSSSPVPTVVITTPKKRKLPFQERDPYTGLLARPSPKKKREIPDSDLASSLPTPPSSGAGTPAPERKRKRLMDDYEGMNTETPSKRRGRIMQIWED